MYRHELTYSNPTAIALDVDDEMPNEVVARRVKWIENFTYTYIGMDLKLNLVAVRSVSNDPLRFKDTVKTVVANTNLPLILCSFNPEVMESGLLVASNNRPLIYAANKENWKEMLIYCYKASSYIKNLPLIEFVSTF